MSVSVIQARSGSKIMVDGAPYDVIENEHVKPGKGQAFCRIKMRNLLTGRVIQKTFPSGATMDAADIIETEMNLLYVDQSGYHFMDEGSYEQYTMGEAEVGDVKKWLVDGMKATVIIWEGKLISVVAENFVILEITECAPNAKGDTVSGGTKLATIETGFEVKVPLFIEQGDKIKIDTRTGEYVSRAK